MITNTTANAHVWNAVVFPGVMKCIPNEPSPLYYLGVRTFSVQTFNEHARLWFSVRAIYHWLPNHADGTVQRLRLKPILGAHTSSVIRDPPHGSTFFFGKKDRHRSCVVSHTLPARHEPIGECVTEKFQASRKGVQGTLPLARLLLAEC
jgi:hypothetical protein